MACSQLVHPAQIFGTVAGPLGPPARDLRALKLAASFAIGPIGSSGGDRQYTNTSLPPAKAW